MADVLVVDDDQSVASAFDRFLRVEGHRPFLASSAADAFRQVQELRPDVVFMDVRMPGVDGLQALEALRQQYPDLYVVIMTAHGTSQTSIDAMRAGAFEYITKPLDLDVLRTVINHALAARHAAADRTDSPQPYAPGVSLVGDVPAMHDVYKLIGRLAAADVPALVCGERGTGKELVVATIHENSARRGGPFVTVDASVATPESFDADVAAARGGTLHIAFVDALPRAQQTQLLRIVRDDASRAGSRLVPAVRVLASTDVDLADAVDDGSFSRELFEILGVVVVNLPPLRARREDVPALVEHFVRRFADQLSSRVRSVEGSALRRLAEHSWPGNVAALEGVIKRACVVARGDVITNADLGETLGQGRAAGRQGAETGLERAARAALHERLAETAASSESVYHDVISVVEAALVGEALTITKGNQVKAAELLGVNRATLRKKADL